MRSLGSVRSPRISESGFKVVDTLGMAKDEGVRQIKDSNVDV